METNNTYDNSAFDHAEEVIENGDTDVKQEDAKEKKSESKKEEKEPQGLLYSLNDKPGWHTCSILGLQHCLLSIGGLIGLPLVLAPIMCMSEDDDGYLARSMVLNTMLFSSGIITFLQTTFGARLPIMQGGSFSFFPSALAILALPHNQCPAGPINANETNATLLYNDTDGSIVDGTELWQRRMREIQGAITVASIVELVLALTGAIGFLLRFVGPLTITPAITLIGISLYEAAAFSASGHWGIAMFTTVVLIISSQYLRNVQVPFPSFSRAKGCHIVKSNFFKLFSVMITIILAWILSVILTSTGALPDQPGEVGYRGRTDVKLNVLYSSPWFRFPYPGQWGLPVVTGPGVVGMLAGVLSGMIESIGDYYACAKLAGGPPLPKHAVNRGLAVEGFGCILSGVLGTGTGTTSYSQNVGAIGITRVGSRRVLQVTGVIFFIVGMLGKFGAILVLIPDPIIGGLFFVLFGMIIAVGLSTLQYVDLNSSRNLFVLGFPLFMGISVPIWLNGNSGAINTGVTELDQIFSVLLGTPIFVGGFLGAFLDNTIPGTDEERGLISWNKQFNDEDIGLEEKERYEKLVKECYNLPFNTNYRFSKYIPFLPEFGKDIQSPAMRRCCVKPEDSNAAL